MSRRRGVAGEEPSALAGWLYADLFLALVIVGLATAWITQTSPPPPKPVAAPTTSSSTTTTSTTPSTTTTAPKAPVTFQLSCDEIFIGPEILGLPSNERDTKIRELVEAAKAYRGWKPTDAKPAIVLLYGGHLKDAASGENAAARVGEAMRAELPDLFSRVEMRSGGATSVRVNGKREPIGTTNRQVGMLIYFVYQGPVRSEDCTA